VGLKQTDNKKDVPVFSLRYYPQIKLTPYDFNDLQLIDKIETYTGTGRVLTLFHCVFTNRTADVYHFYHRNRLFFIRFDCK